MAKEICISSTPHETRLAILEDDQLAEIYYERENEYTLAGSIYNGRVTRVLPGMQSAFVDVGLERDAFLYVTDFMEMEDPEESDELEKAAASGGNQAPREVHSQRGGRGERQEKPERTERPERQERRPAAELATTEAELASPPQGTSEESGDEGQESDGEGGLKRWRGRRRRRGGRGSSRANAPATESQEFLDTHATEAGTEPEAAEEIQAAATPRSGRPERGQDRNQDRGERGERGRDRGDRGDRGGDRGSDRGERHERTAEPFVLPGESLSKYGAGPGETASKAAAADAPAAPARAASSYKPATLIEAPLSWDGSGLLPGESLARHRNRPADVAPESEAESADAVEEQGLVEAMASVPRPEQETTEIFEEEIQPPVAQDLHGESIAAPFDEDMEEESFELPRALPGEATDVAVGTSEEQASEDADGNRSASHNADPYGPAKFRLFGFGGKKGREGDHHGDEQQHDEAGHEQHGTQTPAQRTTSVPSVSAFAPGSGLVEEELIEGEEIDAPHQHHARTEEHDLDEYEEETLRTQIRSGELGEMLQEAHLDHRIQLNFDGKNGEEGDDDAEVEEGEEEEASAEGQPAQEGQQQQRRDRGGRGRRGRGQTNTRRGGGPSRRTMQTSDLPIISDLLKPGQEILVQIAKEPIAKKGARITSHIALPGRFLVFMPTVSHVGVSRKIASDEERQRLKRILTHERGEASGGFIVRTAAEGASEEELRADLRFLIHLWNEIKQRSEASKSPALIYHDLSLIERILRDQVSSNFSSIWVDSEGDYERIVRFLNRFSPTLVRRVKLYTKETPLFEHFGIQDEISKALRSKVWLKSGGSIVINQTEALVAIDINTGKYVGKTARLEDTILKTNLDAIPEIVRQIRLRDLGGIIVIDFIDMDERKNRFKVMAALEEALKNDRAPTKVLQFNDFGLVAITRKRVKQSLERTLSVPCPTCQATGMVKSPATVANEIYTELRKMKRHFEGTDVLLRVNPETVKVLKANNASWINEFEELIGKNILIKSDPSLHPEQFDIQG